VFQSCDIARRLSQRQDLVFSATVGKLHASAEGRCDLEILRARLGIFQRRSQILYRHWFAALSVVLPQPLVRLKRVQSR
jgi:hypothetical protein